MTNIQQAQLTHGLAAKAFLMVDDLEQFTKDKTLTKEAKEVLEACKILQAHCETMLDEVFDIKSVSNGTYLNGLSEKVNYQIKKNFENIK